MLKSRNPVKATSCHFRERRSGQKRRGTQEERPICITKDFEKGEGIEEKKEVENEGRDSQQKLVFNNTVRGPGVTSKIG